MREELSCLSGRAAHLQLPPPVLQNLLVPGQSGCQLLQLSVHTMLTHGCIQETCLHALRQHNQPYSKMVHWLRCRLSFSLLRSSIRCLRGSRSSIHHPGRRPTFELTEHRPCLW